VSERSASLVAEYDQRVGAQQQAEREELDRLRAEVSGQVEAENARRDKAVADAERRAQPRLAQARAAYEHVVEVNRSLRGARRLELPAVVIAAAALSVAGLALGIWPAVSWLPATLAQSAVGIVLGVVLGLVVGRAVRRRRCGAAAAAVATVRRALELEVSGLRQERERVVASLGRRLKNAEAAARARADADAAERKRLVAEGQQSAAAIDKNYDQRVAQIRRATAAEVDPLRRQLADRIQGKPKPAEREYPSYKAAIAEGYRDGTGPSPREMEMTSWERQRALLLLSR
jgi:hypothetical protein